jgi:TPR repeat protein
VARDNTEAVKWLRKAAEQNDDKAQFGLAIRYANGQGVPKDDVEAYKWVILAAAQDNEYAKQNKPNLEGLLSPEQIAEGKRRANDWLEQRRNASAGKSSKP